MNGHVIVPNLIAVDYWKENAAPYFFLTHCHGDHVSPKLRRWSKKIYTSQLNCDIVKLNYDMPSRLLVPLPLGETIAVGKFQVTALDARHCPGSIALLFQGDFGSILYTGDLRFWPGLPHEPALEYVLSGPGLDVLYMDNTYCSPECEFPLREQVLKQVIRYLRECDASDIYIGMRDLGKEEAVLAIAEALKAPVMVSKSRARLLGLCAPSPRWTVEPPSPSAGARDCRIHLVPFRMIGQHGAGGTDSGGRRRVALLLTALFVGSQTPAPYSGGRVQVFPYSDHSSFSELCELVRRLRPRRVMPLVKRWAARGWQGHRDLSARSDMSVFRTYLRLDSPVRQPALPPAAVETAEEVSEGVSKEVSRGASRRDVRPRGRERKRRRLSAESPPPSSPSPPPAPPPAPEQPQGDAPSAVPGTDPGLDSEMVDAASSAHSAQMNSASSHAGSQDSPSEEDWAWPYLVRAGQTVKLDRVLTTLQQVDQWLASCGTAQAVAGEVTSSCD